MTIGILSDTHSCWDARFAIHFADCDEIWHAGDIGDPSILEMLESSCPHATVRAVAGNIDPPPVRRLVTEVQQFEADGIRVCMTHIGGYPGRYAPGVKRILKEQRIGLFISGHSHILKIMPDPELGLLHINPGAAGTQGWQRERTLVKIRTDNGLVKEADVITLSKR